MIFNPNPLVNVRFLFNFAVLLVSSLMEDA